MNFLRHLTADRARELLNYAPETGAFTWRVARQNGAKPGQAAGSRRHDYMILRLDGVNYMAHRVAWLIVHGAWPDGEIDHVNGNKFDNRLANIRPVTHQGNAENKRRARADNKLGVLGVHLDSRRKSRPYVASIRVDGKLKQIGAFASAEEAHRAYVQQKRQVHAACTL
jgi:hypothetical protein